MFRIAPLLIRSTLALAAAGLLLIPAAAPAVGQETALAQAPAAEGITKVAEVEGITEYRLDNGLRVLLFPDRSKQTITVNITYFVGSRNEAYGETGMAHLLEHLVFKGTPDHPDIPQELTEHGSRPNGSTWFDRTNYFETFSATDENLEWALDLEADRMVNSFIAKEDLDSEMTVVRNEFEMGEDSPFAVLMQRTLSAAYLWHNYGNSTIGARADIENVPIERLQAFYRKYYQPDNAMLVVAGDFDEERALELIQENFGSIPRPDRSGANQIYPTYTAEPAQDGERTVTLRRVGDVQIVMAAYHVPSGSDEDFAAIDVLAYVLGDDPSGRLYKALVETGKAARVGSFAFQLREPGILLSFAQVRLEDSLDEARAKMEATIDGMLTDPPTEEEVERAKNSLLKNIELAFNNSERIAIELSEWGANGDWRLRFIFRDRLKEVAPEDVYRVATDYLKPSNRTVGLYIPVEETPARAEIPETPDVAAMVAGYGGGAAIAMGEAFDPSPANIDARTSTSEYASGFKLALLPKQTRGDNVSVVVQMRFGSEKALMGKAVPGDMAGSMLMRGTKKHTRQELQDEFDRLKAQVNVGGDATYASVRIETTSENLPGVLRLVGEILHEPVFDETEWELMKEEQLSGIESRKSQPTAVASVAFGRAMSPYTDDPEHPEYVPTFEEQIAWVESAKLEEARNFWAEFYGADGTTMAVVGDFDTDEIRAICEKIFGSWTAVEAYERFGRPFYAGPAEHLMTETPDKANAMLLAGLGIEMRDSDPDYPAMVLGNYMLGGGFLNSRLAVRIRQEEGLSYGVGSFFSAHPIDEAASLTVYAIFAPENAERVEQAFREELTKVVEGGFTAEEVEAAKQGWLQSQDVSRAQDRSLANDLGGNLFYNRTMAFDAEVERKIADLTPEEILAAMRRHIDIEKFTIVMAGDFEGAKEKASEESGGK
ncbi:MAG: pitrilysin family protein [Gemmatimonadota bacterium]